MISADWHVAVVPHFPASLGQIICLQISISDDLNLCIALYMVMLRNSVF